MMHHHHHQHHYIIINFTSSASSSFSSSANSTCDWNNPQLNIFEMLFIFCFFFINYFLVLLSVFLGLITFSFSYSFTISFSVSPHLILQFNLQHKNKKYYEIDLRSICCCCCCCSRGRIRGGATQGGGGCVWGQGKLLRAATTNARWTAAHPLAAAASWRPIRALLGALVNTLAPTPTPTHSHTHTGADTHTVVTGRAGIFVLIISSKNHFAISNCRSRQKKYNKNKKTQL